MNEPTNTSITMHNIANLKLVRTKWTSRLGEKYIGYKLSGGDSNGSIFEVALFSSDLNLTCEIEEDESDLTK